jgi:hypothetical protein
VGHQANRAYLAEDSIMFMPVIVVTLCSGWLCKAVHGEFYRHELKGRFDTIEQCIGEGELVLRFAAIDPDLRPRVECVRVK